MIFKETAQQVLDGTKTQTRRPVKPGETSLQIAGIIVTVGQADPDFAEKGITAIKRAKWRLGNTYAVQPGRGKKSIGRTPPIKAIRRERLQEISYQDVLAEGVCLFPQKYADLHWVFREVWNSLYRKPYPLYDDEGNIVGYLKCSWEDNPEVWALEFEREA